MLHFMLVFNSNYVIVKINIRKGVIMKKALIAVIMVLMAVNSQAEDAELKALRAENRKARIEFNAELMTRGCGDLCIPVDLPYNDLEAIKADTYYQLHGLRDKLRARGYSFPGDEEDSYLTPILQFSLVLGVLGFMYWCKKRARKNNGKRI
jgi:hypothetical protein